MSHDREQWSLVMPRQNAVQFWIAGHKGLVIALCGSCAIIVALFLAGSFATPVAPASPAHANTAQFSAMRIDGVQHELKFVENDALTNGFRRVMHEVRELMRELLL